MQGREHMKSHRYYEQYQSLRDETCCPEAGVSGGNFDRRHLFSETRQAAVMSNSQEQSLDENAVFLPVNESSPEFLYCERERQAVERLLSAGPEAFYSSIGTERSGCFLSSEEVSQIGSWAQDYHFNQLEVQSEGNGQEGSSEMEDFCSTYFPANSDTPAPDLELGWPENGPWVPKGSITVHTSPPAEGEPPVREIIRRHLQQASQVIAIATDRLTDGAIIGDLHTAASRGVAVYIILNQRTIQENFTLNRLRHPNMRVRVLGGKSFCSRTGRMVVGEMKVKFLLVDLQTAIHGSYSLTWTDAHLHRQLITVLRGPVVDSFDREFRILFAASLPVPDQWRVGGAHEDVAHPLKNLSNLRFQKHLSLEPEITSPPSPPADYLLDWEAMGVVQRDLSNPDSPLDRREQIAAKEMPLQNHRLFDKNTHIMDEFTNSENQFVGRRRLIENTSPVTNNVPDKPVTFNSTQPSSTDLRSQERWRSVEHIVEKALHKQLSKEKSYNLDDRRITRVVDKDTERAHNVVQLSSAEREERSRREPIVEDECSLNEISSKVQNTPTSRKPLILMVPQAENFKSLSDLMKRFQPQRSTSGLLKRGSKATASEMSQSMMDLSVHDKDANNVLVPRFKASCFDPGHTTPAFALMKKRSDEIKPFMYRTPKNFMPRERPRSSSYAFDMDWRAALAGTDGDKELGARKYEHA